MQGMVIQNLSAVPETKGNSASTGLKELPEQPFGEVLGTEAEKTVASTKPDTEQAESEQILQMEILQKDVVTQEEGLEKSATPFFMAALFDQSATFVEPSENTELVSAAERVQELIGNWLTAQQEGGEAIEGVAIVRATMQPDSQEVIEEIPSTQIAEQPSNAELVAAAVEALDQAGVETVQSAESDAVELQQSVLSPEEVAELRQLMAIMMQSGQVPEQYQGHPLIAELRQQLAENRDFTRVERSQGQVVNPELSPVLVTESGTEGQRGVKAGLQENQIAGLLNPRQEQPSLHELKAAKMAPEPQMEIAQVVEGEAETVSELQPEKAKSAMTSNFQTQQVVHVAAGQRLDPQVAVAAPKIMQLPSGLQLAENQLVDQVVTYLAGSNDGESGRMRLRLNPAELGSLRLDLMVDGDRVRAHIQAQSQQVQEVLDRYLPQLRDALQQQGLKIDEFRVDVQGEQDQSEGQAYAWQQQGEPDHSSKSPWLEDDWQQELELPLEQLLEQTSTGISVRV